LVADFDRQLCARPALAELSGRFLFALDDGSADVLGLAADVTLTAVSPNRLQLVLAGVPTGLQVPVAGAVDLMLAAAQAFLAERAAQRSSGWRVTELSDGPARIIARLTNRTGDRPAPAHRPQPVAGPLLPGPISQTDGRIALAVGIPLGRLSSAQARALAGPELILTPWRSVVLPDLAAAEASRLIADSSRLGLITDSSHPLVGVTACTGRPGCASALADVRADALATQLAAPAIAGVHWAGCARRCGRPAGTVTDIVATGTGYSISTGDRTQETGSEPAAVSAALLAGPSSLLAAR
jgi:precorrin-3B synthase